MYGLENFDTKEIVLVNKCDPKFAQAMQYDVELTFAAKDVNGDSLVLRFYKGDDTLEVYKIVGPNDGILGGKIDKRWKYQNK